MVFKYIVSSEPHITVLTGIFAFLTTFQTPVALHVIYGRVVLVTAWTSKPWLFALQTGKFDFFEPRMSASSSGSCVGFGSSLRVQSRFLNAYFCHGFWRANVAICIHVGDAVKVVVIICREIKENRVSY